MKTLSFSFSLSLALLACAGCSGAPGASSSGSFPITVMSDSRTLHVELDASPPPVVGTNTVELTVTRASDGAPQDGLSISAAAKPTIFSFHTGSA